MKFRAREEELSALLHPSSVSIHPLLQSHQASKENVAGSRHSVEFASPSLLQEDGIVAAQVEDDPLRSSVAVPEDFNVQLKSRHSKKTLKGLLDKQVEDANAEWDSYRFIMAQRFASSGTITVSTAYDVLTKDYKVRAASTHLQQLDDPEMKSYEDVKVYTQQEYITRLKELNEEILEAWTNDERVSALRLTIKVAKIMMDTSAPQFYPTLFVLVTDILESVGDLVWNRIKQKAEVDGAFSDICEEAKDTCANWFLKVGSIKELLPRVYLEIAILRCLHFLQSDLTPALERLSRMIRGLGDPLASAYAHIYLSRKGLALLPYETGYLVSGIHEFSTLLRRVLSEEFDHKLSELHIQKQTYLSLLEPMFEWVLRCIFRRIKQEEIQDVVVALCAHHNVKPLGVLVHHLLKQLPPTFVGNHSTDLSRLVRGSLDVTMAQSANFVLLGSKLCECPPPREYRFKVLNDVWKASSKYSALRDYVEVVNAFLEYILKWCSENELFVVLQDLKSRLSHGNSVHEVFSSLESIVLKIVDHHCDLRRALSLDGFVDIVDMFHGDSRVSVYKYILSSVSRNNVLIEDPVCKNFLFAAAKALHDSLDSLSTDDDRRQISRLVVRFVQLADYGSTLEHHLDFLVDCRARFPSMDSVREVVVHVSNRVAVTALDNAKGSHSRHSLDYVKACVTFNEVTIPSIASITRRLQLFLETSEVALMNGLLSHTISLLRSGILCLQELQAEDAPQGYEDEVLSALLKLCSFLVVVPGDPELGALYFLRALLNLLESKPWFLKGRKRVKLLGGILLTVSTLSQDQLPYHVELVDSNDSLYYGDSSYQDALSNFAALLVERMSAVIEEEKPSQERGYLLLDAINFLFSAFVSSGEVVEKASTFLTQAVSILSKEDRYLVTTRRLVNKILYR